MNFNIRNGAKLKYTIPAGGVGDNFLVVDPSSGEVSFRTPSEVGALAIGGSSGDVLYNNSGVIGGFGDWNGTRLEIGGNFKLGESAQVGSERTITADGSAGDVAITLTPKGSGAVTAGSAIVNVGKTGDTLIDNVSSSTNSSTTLRSKGTGGAVLKSPSGNVVLSAGASSEVVLGESTTAATTRIISAEGTASDVDIILEPKGVGTLISEANFTIGSTSLSGSSRTIKSGGSAANVDLILASKGDGNVSLISETPDYGSGVNVTFIPNSTTPTSVSPVGGGTIYSSSQDLVWFGIQSYNLTNQFLGKDVNSVVKSPSVTEDGQGLVWDNTSGEYTLGTLTASAGGTNTQLQYNNSGNLGGFGSWDGAIMTVPGSFQIGDSGTAGTNRNITAESSVGNVSITLVPKGTANIILAVDGGQINIGSGTGSTRTIQAVGSSTNVSLILSGQGSGVVYTGSNFYIGEPTIAGSDRILAPEGSATDINLQIVPKGDGNISLFSTTPTYGGGEGVIYIKSATTAPSGSITGGGGLYATASAIRFVNSSGTDYDLTQTAFVAVRKNSTGGDIGVRRRINFIEGTNITMTIADDVGDDEIDVTIEATAGGGGYTDEEAQDAVGSILVDTSSINFTYDDATPQIFADVISDSNVQRIAIRKNSTGGDTGTRRRLNFIESGPISLTLADDGLNNELDITIGSSATTLSGYGITNAWNTGSGAALTANNTISGAFEVDYQTTTVRFRNNQVLINNPANTFEYTIVASAITGDRTLTIPQITTNQHLATIVSSTTAGRIPFASSTLGALTHDSTFLYSSGLLTTTRLLLGTSITAGSVLADFQSTTEGVVMPRVTNIASVATPVNGMIAYDAATNLFNLREGGSWNKIIKGSTGAVDNAILRADGTGGVTLQNAPLIIDDDASFTLGLSSTAGTQRFIAIDGSSADIDLYINPKGEGNFYLQSGNSLFLTAEDISYESETSHNFKNTISSTSAEIRLYEGSSNGTNYIAFKPTSAVTNTVTYTLPEAPSVSGYVLSSTTGGVMSWAAKGDVVGTGSSTDNAVTRFDSTTGKLIQNSNVTISDGTGSFVVISSNNTNAIIVRSDSNLNTIIDGGLATSGAAGDVWIRGGLATGGATRGSVSINKPDANEIDFKSGEAIIHIANGVTQPSAAPDSGSSSDGFFLMGRDSSDGNSTVALYTQQAPEATATFTQTHRFKIWINGQEFWISLDAV